jgi:hypothetical protein
VVRAGGQTLRGWVRSGGSDGADDERVARFGLGAAGQVERVAVRWPSGTVDRLGPLPANQVLTLHEGQAKG